MKPTKNTYHKGKQLISLSVQYRYISLEEQKPEEGRVVICGMHEQPLAPKSALYKFKSFWLIEKDRVEYMKALSYGVINNEFLQLFPTHWAYND